jgi:hypothetical protein
MPRTSVLLAKLGANIKTGGFTRGFHSEMGWINKREKKSNKKKTF